MSSEAPSRRMVSAWRGLLGCLAALALVSGATGRAEADPVADFYQGKNIELVVGGNAGGGYDIYARALARHLPAHIPGSPRIIIKNAPGAGSLIATRSLYVQAPKDGTAGLDQQSAEDEIQDRQRV